MKSRNIISFNLRQAHDPPEVFTPLSTYKKYIILLAVAKVLDLGVFLIIFVE